ncbi:MAG: septum formation initiator family protein [Prevotella sp.]|nr:septum formation initiator family protein [Prevotella sp.]
MLRLVRNNYVKYIVVLTFGVVFVGFLDENSIWSHLRNKQRIADLQEEISHYEAEYNRDQQRIHQLKTDPKAMEKIARERYFMRAPDEDIFVLSDDEAETVTQIPENHETTE